MFCRWLVLRIVCRKTEEGEGGRYHGGSGSLWLRLLIREPSEWVSWMRRWRDCSRVLSWSWVGVVILLGCCPGKWCRPGSISFLSRQVEVGGWVSI